MPHPGFLAPKVATWKVVNSTGGAASRLLHPSLYSDRYEEARPRPPLSLSTAVPSVNCCRRCIWRLHKHLYVATSGAQEVHPSAGTTATDSAGSSPSCPLKPPSPPRPHPRYPFSHTTPRPPLRRRGPHGFAQARPSATADGPHHQWEVKRGKGRAPPAEVGRR